VVQHLQVLEKAGLVESRKTGRVRTCRVSRAGLGEAEQWIRHVRTQWEDGLDRLGELLAEPDVNPPTEL
jgi:DNA-binding transcriptional ArsR family regulator